MTTFSAPLNELTHEEIANEAITIGRTRGDSELIDLGRELLDAVENERDSQAIVDRIAAHEAE